jgi:hypothetical protein
MTDDLPLSLFLVVVFDVPVSVELVRYGNVRMYCGAAGIDL